MHAHQSLLALALVLAAAVSLGLVMNRLRMPAAAGFILVGVALGPTGAGLIHNSSSIETLAELGVLMLLFIIGMEMRLASFSKSLPLALGVTAVTCLVIPVSVALFTYAVHGEIMGGIVIGFIPIDALPHWILVPRDRIDGRCRNARRTTGCGELFHDAIHGHGQRVEPKIGIPQTQIKLISHPLLNPFVSIPGLG